MILSLSRLGEVHWDPGGRGEEAGRRSMMPWGRRGTDLLFRNSIKSPESVKGSLSHYSPPRKVFIVLRDVLQMQHTCTKGERET